MGLQFAVKLGFYTVVVSKGSEKEALAKELGAHKYINVERQNAVEEIQVIVFDI